MMKTASDDQEDENTNEEEEEGFVDVAVVNEEMKKEMKRRQEMKNSSEETTNHSEEDSSPPPTTTSTTVSTSTTSSPLAEATANTAATTTTTTTTSDNASNCTHFPCIEQPQRVTLHNCGYYLWSYRNGKAVARKKRSEKDEFHLEYVLGQNIVKITNHKFGGILSAIVDEKNPDGDRKIVFIKPPKTKEEEKKKEAQKKKGDEDKNAQSEKKDDDEDDEEEDESPVVTTDQSININPEDQQWFFVKGNHNRIHLKSLATGQNLAILKDSGNLTLVTDSIVKLHPHDKFNSPKSNITTSWDIECVTGELCFISCPRLNTRIRCDMAGLLTTTPTTKGWEVFRFMEASHGYVKISSWMHKQWLLCGQADGSVTTCSHADSFLEDDIDLENESNEQEGNADVSKKKKKKKTKCSKWAIMKYIPPSEDGNGNEHHHGGGGGGGGGGVIIRNKTFGRLLCIKDGCILHTIDPNDPNDEKLALAKRIEEAGFYDDDEEDDDAKIEAPSARSTATASTSTNNLNKWWSNSQKAMNTSMRKGMDNWSENSKNMSTSMRLNMNKWSKSMNKSMNTMMKSGGAEAQKEAEEDIEAPPPPAIETIEWHIEAAHSQTYYFLNAPLSTAQNDDDDSNKDEEEKDTESNKEEESKKEQAPPVPPKSIGPYPNVTPNLRQTEKIQLIRKKDGTTKLNLIDQNKFISCTANGQIVSFDQNVFDTSARGINFINDDDESTDWIMDKHPKFPDSGSTFRSKLYGYYLSYKAIEEEEEEEEENKNEEEEAAAAGTGEDETAKDDGVEATATAAAADSSEEDKQQQQQQQQQASTTSTNSMMTVMFGRSSSSLGSSSRRQKKKSDDGGDNTLNNSMAMMNNMFSSRKEPIPTLVGVELIDELCVWNLQPCMPRAVSSEKIKTFALGTGIAVGTTIAMPFALAGVGAVLGAVGAEVGIVANAIAVGLTGAEALASVGAIGATAYIVFRPEENSLTDAPKLDDDDEEAKAEVEWSKRPLSNWREW